MPSLESEHSDRGHARTFVVLAQHSQVLALQQHVMSSTAATSVTAEAEQLPRKGPRKGAATPAVATSDRLRNRERQSLAQATQLAAKLYLASPGSVYTVKHVVTTRKSTTHIIFNRGGHQHQKIANFDALSGTAPHSLQRGSHAHASPHLAGEMLHTAASGPSPATRLCSHVLR